MESSDEGNVALLTFNTDLPHQPLNFDLPLQEIRSELFASQVNNDLPHQPLNAALPPQIYIRLLFFRIFYQISFTCEIGFCDTPFDASLVNSFESEVVGKANNDLTHQPLSIFFKQLHISLIIT